MSEWEEASLAIDRSLPLPTHVHGQHLNSVSSLNKTDAPAVNIRSASNWKDFNIKHVSHQWSINDCLKPVLTNFILVICRTSQLLSSITEKMHRRGYWPFSCNKLPPTLPLSLLPPSFPSSSLLPSLSLSTFPFRCLPHPRACLFPSSLPLNFSPGWSEDDQQIRSWKWLTEMTYRPHSNKNFVDNQRPWPTHLQLQSRLIVCVWISVTNNHCPSRKLPLKLHQIYKHTDDRCYSLAWSATKAAVSIKILSSIEFPTDLLSTSKENLECYMY